MFAPTKHNDKESGFVALVTAILISVSLLIMVGAISLQGFSSRFSVLESELKEESAFLAESCVQTARLKIAQDVDYHLSATFPEVVPVGGHYCEIVEIDYGTFADWRVIKARGTSSDAYTNLEVEVDADTPPEVRIVSFEEVGSF